MVDLAGREFYERSFILRYTVKIEGGVEVW